MYLLKLNIKMISSKSFLNNTNNSNTNISKPFTNTTANTITTTTETNNNVISANQAFIGELQITQPFISNNLNEIDASDLSAISIDPFKLNLVSNTDTVDASGDVNNNFAIIQTQLEEIRKALANIGLISS
jgi:hypothetical protein